MRISPISSSVNFKGYINNKQDTLVQTKKDAPSYKKCSPYMRAMALSALMMAQAGCWGPSEEEIRMNDTINVKYPLIALQGRNIGYVFDAVQDEKVRDYLYSIQNEQQENCKTMSEIKLKDEELPFDLYVPFESCSCEKIMSFFEKYPKSDEAQKEGYRKFKQIYNAYTSAKNHERTLRLINDNTALFNTNLVQFADNNANPSNIVNAFAKNLIFIAETKTLEDNANEKYSKVIKQGIPLTLLNLDEVKDMKEFLPLKGNQKAVYKTLDAIDITSINLFEDINNPTTKEGKELAIWHRNIRAVSSLDKEQKGILDTINNNFDLFENNVKRFSSNDKTPKEQIYKFVDNIKLIEETKNLEKSANERYNKILNSKSALFIDSTQDINKFSGLLHQVEKLKETAKPISRFNLKNINLLKDISQQTGKEEKDLICSINNTKQQTSLLNEIANGLNLSAQKYNSNIQAAYNAGFNTGKAQGLKEGYQKGYQKGKEQGSQEGYQKGKDDADGIGLGEYLILRTIF